MIDSLRIEKGVIVETYEGLNTKWEFIEGLHFELSQTNNTTFNGYKIYSPEDGKLPTVLFATNDEIDSVELMRSLIKKYNKFSSEVSINDFHRVSLLTQLKILLVGLKMEDFSTNFWEERLQYAFDNVATSSTEYQEKYQLLKESFSEEWIPDWYHYWLLFRSR
ncbi:MAG: hypothetical protein LPK79_13675 [Bacteroidota bacterium]|nr:hypothetical protein [Bacteroidota bacterium]